MSTAFFMHQRRIGADGFSEFTTKIIDIVAIG